MAAWTWEQVCRSEYVVFLEYSLPEAKKLPLKTQCDNILKRRNWVLGECSWFKLPKSIFCFAGWHPYGTIWGFIMHCIFPFFVFAYYMMPPVVWFSKTSPLKAFVCLNVWRSFIIQILISFINNSKKGNKICYKTS